MVQKSSNLDNKETVMKLFSGTFRGFPDMRPLGVLEFSLTELLQQAETLRTDIQTGEELPSLRRNM